MSTIKVFVINLKTSQARRDYISQQLQNQGIEFSFFDAIDGNDKKNPLLNRYNYAKRLWLTSGKTPTSGEVGCYASHYSLWQKCVDIGQPIVVIEDDSGILPDAKKTLSLVKEKINEYGYLKLESIIRGDAIIVENGDNYQISWMADNFGGARAYAVSPWAAQKLLSGSESWSLPVDNYIGAPFMHGINSYHINPYIVGNEDLFETTIQFYNKEKAPLYRKPSRELYSLYFKIRLYLHNIKTKRKLLAKNYNSTNI